MMMSEVNQYAERDLMAMDIAGNHYCRHVDHMTSEKLHSKSDIAAELGWRDMQIAALKAERDALAAENAALKNALMVTLEYVDVMDYGAAGVVAMIAFDALHSNKTPATDAYANQLRAEGVEMFAKQTRAIGEQERCAEIIYAAVNAETFAANLRKGNGND